MVLVDTSVWIEVFRKDEPLALESLVSLDDVATCLPVIQEVLQGIRGAGAYRVAREALTSLPILESSRKRPRRAGPRAAPGSPCAPGSTVSLRHARSVIM